MPIDRPVLLDSSGKVLLDASGQLADPNCCCAPAGFSCGACGLPPPGFCVHVICFTFNVDQSEMDEGGNGDFIDLRSSFFGTIFGVYPDYPENKWRAYGPNGDSFVAIMGDGSPAGTEHTAQLSFAAATTGDLTVQLCVDGNFSDTWTEPGPLLINTIDAGSRFTAQPSHRSISSILLNGGFLAQDFSFPAESFTSFIGSGVSVIDSVLRVDSTSEAYAETGTTGGDVDLFCKPDVSLGCDQVAVTVTRCGFSSYHGFLCPSGVTDLGYGTTYTFTGCSGEFGNCVTSIGGDSDTAKVYQTQTAVFNGATQDGSCTTNCDTCGSQTVIEQYNLSTCIIEVVSINAPLTCCDPCFGCEDPEPPCELGCPGFFSHPVSGSATLTDEITTDFLISQAEGTSLPDYDDDFDDTCLASRTLSEDETTFSIARFKVKFTFSEAAFDFTIHYNEHFVPDVGDPVDTPRSLSVSIGETEVSGPEVLEPDENGEITITDIEVTVP